MPKVEAPRGTRDIAPEEAAVRRWALERLVEQATRRGFSEVQTPTFEHLELFTLKSGPGIVDQLYAFEDKGGRELALRPELTAPVMRFFAQGLKARPKPLKLWYFGPCFRYERPQSGRYREFTQFGAEVVGPDTPEADAEAIALASAAVDAVGLEERVLKVGHIGFLDRIVADGLGLDEATRREVYPLIDKKDAKVLDHPALADAGPLVREVVERTVEDTPFAPEALDDITDRVDDDRARAALGRLGGTVETLEAFGVEDARVDLGVVRGLDYYTGVVFEIEAPRLGAEKQVCGGGAYALSELFGGQAVGSTGFALGFDRLLLAVEAEGHLPDAADVGTGITAYVVPIGDAQRGPALALAERLRAAGVACDVDLSRRGPSKNLDHANAVGARLALLLGEDEVSRGVVAVKDLASGDQEDVPADAVVGHVREAASGAEAAGGGAVGGTGSGGAGED